MTSTEVRQSFLDFFKSKNHKIVSSESLLPTAPNLLFTNAGMNQFVPSFLGERPPPHSRVANSQKCIRAGGKHNDLDDVGFDTYHHTFFEMLGNWSFGDYFKKEAIDWAWELLTKVWGFPKERLYATVYKPGKNDPSEIDQEAWNYWAEIFKREGLDPKIHIIFGEKKDNFWMMGDTGPCGPCSEVHMDLTENGDTNGSLVNADSPYTIEIWNLVFIQFNATSDGKFKPLAEQHVDTGMGFERVAGIMATTNKFTDFSKAPSNYNCDIFTDIFNDISQLSGKQYKRTVPTDRINLNNDELVDCIFRILSDHIRTLCFSIADGIIPGNEGRNYVIRRILRRAVMYGRKLDLKAGFLVQLVDTVIEKFGPVFPELIENRETIKKIIKSEESAFDRTIDRGIQILEKIIANKSKEISGKQAFELYDTYGFPYDLTELIANENNIKIDYDGFNLEMEKQRSRGRASQKKTEILVSKESDNKHATKFTGYDISKTQCIDAIIEEVIQSDNNTYFVFDQTPFYAEMGGQIGDTGFVTINEDTKIKLTGTIKDSSGRYLHHAESNIVNVNEIVGYKVKLSVDHARRQSIQRHHTATHILHWALREVLGKHVKQAGSLVTDDRLRFDISHFEQPTSDQIQKIEKLANQQILANSPVTWTEMPFDQKPKNCLAFFGDKYGAIVRVVDIGGWSVELCGGTHVLATGEIGIIKIVQESAIAAGTRRIEAVVGESAYDLVDTNFNLLKNLSNKLSCLPKDFDTRFNSLLEQNSELEKQLRKLRQSGTSNLATELANLATKIGDINLVTAKVEVTNPNDMRALAVNISKKIEPSVIVLGGEFNKKANVLALCSSDAIKAGHKAGDIVKQITQQLDGKGGGKPDFAMGGGKDVEKLESVLNNFSLYNNQSEK